MDKKEQKAMEKIRVLIEEYNEQYGFVIGNSRLFGLLTSCLTILGIDMKVSDLDIEEKDRSISFSGKKPTFMGWIRHRFSRK